MQRYIKYFTIPNFETTFLDEALTLAYCVDACVCNLADVTEADALAE